jgi:hypothetical protein
MEPAVFLLRPLKERFLFPVQSEGKLRSRGQNVVSENARRNSLDLKQKNKPHYFFSYQILEGGAKINVI